MMSEDVCNILREEDLAKMAKEGKLEDTLKELKQLAETWEKMTNKHESTLASYASVKPESTNSIDAVIEKEKEMMDSFQRDIKQIEEYIEKHK
jgi:DNA-directed RNA polymerase subunit F